MHRVLVIVEYTAGKPTCILEDNIKMDSKGKKRALGQMAQDRVKLWASVNIAMNMCLPQNVRNFFASLTIIRFLRKHFCIQFSF